MKENNTNIDKVPNLRFPEFTGEWEVKKLGEVMEFIKDKLPSASLSTKNYVSTENLLQDFQGITLASSIPSNVNVTAYKAHDILFSNIRPYLKKIWKANLSGGCSSDVFVFRNNESCLSGFLYYSIANEDFINYVMIGAKGVKMPRGDKEQIQQYPISLPSLTEQAKIVSFLSLIDERILTQIKIIEGLKELKASLSKQLFSRKLRFKDDNDRDFPEWEEKKLGEVLKVGSGRDYKHLKEGNIPVFGTGGYMTSVNEFLFDGESVCIGRKGTINKPFYFNGKFWTVDTLFYTYSYKNVLPKFIFNVFEQINWLMYNEASGVPSLSKSTIEQIDTLIPDISEQRKIASALSAFDDKIKTEEKILERYVAQKKFFLKQMFI